MEKIFALAEEAAALKEALPELLDLAPAARQRWPPPRLAELPRLCRRAKSQLGRNCNRALVCEVLFFDLL